MNENPEQALIAAEIIRALDKEIANLRPREQEVLKLRLGFEGDCRSYAEIGKALGFTKERGRQIFHAALRRLQHPSHLVGLANAGHADAEKKWHRWCREFRTPKPTPTWAVPPARHEPPATKRSRYPLTGRPAPGMARYYAGRYYLLESDFPKLSDEQIHSVLSEVWREEGIVCMEPR